MGKTKKRFNDWDDDEENFNTNHSQHLKEKRLDAAIKSKNVDKLLELEEDSDDFDYYSESDDNYYEYGYAAEWEEYKKKSS